MNPVIGIGNTIAKMAVFRNGSIMEIFYDFNQTLEQLLDICAKYPVDKAIVTAVTDLGERVLAQLARLPVPLLWLDEKTPLPVENFYKTLQTLRYGRIVAVVEANEQFPGKDVLVVDTGTCVTYEFIDTAGRHHDGDTSPGVQTCFKALHGPTGQLPLAARGGRRLPSGKGIDTTMREDALKGMEYEISGYITTMKHKYSELLVFLADGDDFSFDTNLKSIIFVGKFLVLKGLNKILNYSNDRV